MSRGLPAQSDATGWVSEEAQDLLRSMQRLWPSRVEYTTIHQDGRSVAWELQLDFGILQANACKCLQ